MKQRRSKRLIIELERVKGVCYYYYIDLNSGHFMLCGEFVKLAKQGKLPERLRLIVSDRRFKKSTLFTYTATDKYVLTVISGSRRIRGVHWLVSELASRIECWLQDHGINETRLYGRLDTVRKGAAMKGESIR